MSKFKEIPSMASLLAFEAAARMGNFTAAANELDSTQSAVSQKIQRLESELNLVLFHRENRGARLTEAGEKLLSSITDGLKIISDGITEVQNIDQHISINVVTDYAFAAFWLLPLLPKFNDTHANIDVSLTTSEQLIGHSKGADVVIGFGNGVMTNYHSHLLFKEQVKAVCSQSLLDKMGTHSFTELPLLELNTQYQKGYFTWESMFARLDIQRPPQEAHFTFNNYTLLIQAAIAGQGVAIGWVPLLNSLLESKLLVPVTDEVFHSDYGYYIYLSDQKKTDPVVNDFVHWLIEASQLN